MSDSASRNSRGAPLREALLDQLAYLASEADAICTVIAHVPEPVLESRPVPDAPTIKELYALLLRLDETANLSFVSALSAGEVAALQRPEPHVLLTQESWNECSIEEILARLALARRRLTDTMRELSPEAWSRTGTVDGQTVDLYSFAFDVVQHDVDVLRVLGERFFEARPPTALR